MEEEEVMAIKKYISPDVFPLTIRDNFRKLMGHHYVIDAMDGTVRWNEDAITLPDLVVPALVIPSVSVVLEPRTSDQTAKVLNFSKVPSNPTPEDLITGITIDRNSGAATLAIKVTAPAFDSGGNVNYGSLGRFTEDMEYVFSNPTDSDFYHDRTFEYTTPDVDSYISFSSYNYLVEPYETAIQTASETILPNHYNISIVERSGDEAEFIFDASAATLKGAVGIYKSTPGANFEPYQDTLDHTLLMGSINSAVIRDQGLYSDSYIESEYLEKGLSIEDFLQADLIKSLDVKYTNYFNTWPESYIDLTTEDQFLLEEKGKNIIFSGLVGSSLLELNKYTALATQNKLPFYTVLYFEPELYSTRFLYDEVVSPQPIDPVATQLKNNLLYSTFGSHIAGVYDPSYVDPVPLQPEYLFTSKTFIDADNSGEVSFLASAELHDYVNYASTGVPNTDANNSFLSAISYSGAYSIGLPATASPVGSFQTDKKLFIDVKYDQELETDLALRLAVDPEIDYDNAVPLPAQSLAVIDYIYQTTQLTTNYSLIGTDIAGLYGPGDTFGLANQINESFNQRQLGFGGTNTLVGRLYEESFEQGLPSMNETVMYRVAKYVGKDTSVPPIQNIWIPANVESNLSKTNAVQYVDSQVKYDQEYTYVTSAFKYVFGLKYKYEKVSEPKVTIVETAIDAGGTVGFIIGWTGFANLFEDWERAIEEIASSTDPPWATYANLYDPSYNYEDREPSFPSDAPGFFRQNRAFVSIERLNEILEKSWTLVPQTGFQFLVDSPPTNQSWAQLFAPGGGSAIWQDRYKITPDTPLGGDGERVRYFISQNDYESIGALDPSTFSVRDWLDLFFGSGYPSDSEYSGYYPGLLPSEYRLQWFPPSHHILTSLYAEGGGVSVVGATGFEDLVDPRDIEDDTDDLRFTYGSVEAIVPGATSMVDMTGYEATYQIKMHPTVEIVEVPYFTTSTSVQSKPPPPPDVTIIPYRGVNDTLIFNISANNIEVQQYPISIEEGDKERFETIREAQGVLPGGKINFVADDTTAFFQIYRMDEPPSKYSDFSGKLRNTLSTIYPNNEQIVRSTAISHNEKLTPNTKYYYTFRSIDYHGNFSNPTSVYEVELVDDGGAVYLLVKLHDMPLLTAQTPSIDMKKFIQIVPSLSQVTADVPINTRYDDPSDIPLVTLGTDEVSSEGRIWDKTFKVRLTSKKTGKKIDLNLSFNKDDKRIKTT